MYSEVVYSEVYSFLNILDEDYINKIPQKFREYIDKKRKQNYEIKYDLSIPLYKQNVSKEAISIIALIHLKYWCKNEEEKNNLLKIFSENSKIEELEKAELYSYDKIFKNRKTQINVKNDNDCIQIIPYKKSFIKTIINKIKHLFY
ncbi:MAG: hypothetical protein IJV31_12520 [Clostridia bacterium]|nr:hypothetical protein [Clostridia bacterium]